MRPPRPRSAPRHGSAASGSACSGRRSTSWRLRCRSTSCTCRTPPAGSTVPVVSQPGAQRAPMSKPFASGHRRCGPALDAATVVVCCGSGGVGKTTVAAALGVEAARRGRRVVVLTIDPAKRLADALGVDELGAEPAAHRARRRLRRRAVGDDARHRGGVHRRRAALRRRRRAGRPHRRQRLLPQHGRVAERHAGVHGRRDAAPARRRRPLRPRRRRHAADPQRARLPRRPGRARPLPRPSPVQAADAAGAARACG